MDSDDYDDEYVFQLFEGHNLINFAQNANYLCQI